MVLDPKIDRFLAGQPHAVVGASADRHKYGNRVLRTYLQKHRPVYPVNPHATEIEGHPAFPSLAELPEPVHGISIITPPEVTEQIVAEAIELGIGNIWMQPGAESQRAIEQATAAGVNVIAGGPCLLVVLGFHDSTEEC